MPHHNAVIAARSLHGPVAVGKDDELSLLNGNRLAASLGARSLFIEQKLTSRVIAPLLIQNAGRLQWESHFAVQILMEAIVIPCLVTQDQGRRFCLLLTMASSQELRQCRWKSLSLVHSLHPAIGDQRQRRIEILAQLSDERR